MAQVEPRLDQEIPEPPRIRALRRLVTVLTATMILGLLTIIVLVVITLTRFSPSMPLPENITLSAGETAQAITKGKSWFALVTIDGNQTERIRIFDAKTAEEIQSVTIEKSQN